MLAIWKKIGESIEESILVCIIILNIFDFAELLNPDWDFLKKIISWTALGYLVYRANLTEIFFGEKNNKLDFVLIIAYFLLSFKNIIGYSMSTINQLTRKGSQYWANLHLTANAPEGVQIVQVTSRLNDIDLNLLEKIPVGNSIDRLVDSFTIIMDFPPHPNTIILNITNNISSRLIELQPKFYVHAWLNYLIQPGVLGTIQNITIGMGAAILIIFAFYITWRVNIYAPSLMHVIHEEGPPVTFREPIKFFTRFVIILLVLNFFFIVVFNLMMEWLAIAIDAPLLIIGIFVYLLFLLKHHKKFSTESFVYKLGNIGEEFYNRFISLFHSNKGLILAVSGMLVLHLLTDVGNFIVPYTIGIYDSLYFDQLGPGHDPVFSIKGIFTTGTDSLLGADLMKTTGIAAVSLTMVYLLNYWALLLLLLIPPIVWYFIFSEKVYDIPKWITVLFFSSIACFLYAPIFNMKKIGGGSLVGVDIVTQSLLSHSSYSMHAVLFISIFIGLIIYLLISKTSLKQYINYGAVIISVAFFAYYIYLFFMDISNYYLRVVTENFKVGDYFIGGYFFMFFMLTILFYVGGFVCFVYEVVES